MQVLAINKRVQTQNNAPLGFPNFVRDGYEIIILADGYSETQEGLIWKVTYGYAHIAFNVRCLYAMSDNCYCHIHGQH